MQLTIIDPHVSDTMNGFLIIANIINVVYNIPQMVRTYHSKTTRDFSSWFIFLRIIGNLIWLAYSINIDSLQMLINNSVTVIASLFISYYKCRELYADYNIHKQITCKNEYKALEEYNPLHETTLDDDTLLETDTLENTENLLKHTDDIV